LRSGIEKSVQENLSAKPHPAGAFNRNRGMRARSPRANGTKSRGAALPGAAFPCAASSSSDGSDLFDLCHLFDLVAQAPTPLRWHGRFRLSAVSWGRAAAALRGDPLAASNHAGGATQNKSK
jgi:hypothetical protein